MARGITRFNGNRNTQYRRAAQSSGGCLFATLTLAAIPYLIHKFARTVLDTPTPPDTRGQRR